MIEGIDPVLELAVVQIDPVEVGAQGEDAVVAHRVQEPGFPPGFELALALHPDFAENGYLYVFYTAPGSPYFDRVSRDCGSPRIDFGRLVNPVAQTRRAAYSLRMDRIHYAGDSVLTGTKIAEALLVVIAVCGIVGLWAPGAFRLRAPSVAGEPRREADAARHLGGLGGAVLAGHGVARSNRGLAISPGDGKGAAEQTEAPGGVARPLPLEVQRPGRRRCPDCSHVLVRWCAMRRDRT